MRKICPNCGKPTISIASVFLHNAPIIRRYIICPACGAHLATKVPSIALFFSAAIGEWMVFLSVLVGALIFFKTSVYALFFLPVLLVVIMYVLVVSLFPLKVRKVRKGVQGKGRKRGQYP